MNAERANDGGLKMREIKFRGKINKESDFIYGSLLVIDEETYIYPYDYGDLDDVGFGYAFEKVLPETVGQFTGLHDKNGKEIYEGDIVRVENWVNYAVKFRDDIACFTLCQHIIGNTWETTLLEIIGNIHENQELINER